MKKITKILLPLITVAPAISTVPAIASCSKEYDPYVILPTKQVEAYGVPAYTFIFQIKEEGTVYARIDAKATLTNKSRTGVTVDVITSVIGDDNHSLNVLVEMSKTNGYLRGGDWVEFDLELKCFKNETDINPEWTTVSKGYKISYKVESFNKLFKYETDGYTGEKTLIGWSTIGDETKSKEYRNQAVEANDGVLEFPYDITKLSPSAKLEMPEKCTSIKFRKDALTHSVWGPQDENTEKGTPSYPGAFDCSKTWNVKEFIIGPSVINLGNPFENSTEIASEITDGTLVFPEPSSKDGITIDLTAWTRKNIGRIFYKKSGADFWQWSKNAWYYYTDCTNSVIKVQAGTSSTWKKYFDLAGFTFGEQLFTNYWTIEEV